MDNLYESYGDKIECHNVFKNKKGVVCALGFKSEQAPYSFSYAIFPNGDEMQKIANWEFTNEGLKKHYLSLLKSVDGKCKLTSTVVDEASITRSRSVNFSLGKKESQSVDLMQHLKTLPMPKKRD